MWPCPSKSHLRLTRWSTPCLVNSLLVELLAPNKSDTLPFLTNKTTTPPPRCARATLMFGATPNPYLQDYVVGPLPVANNTQVQPLQFLYNNAGKGKVAVDFADRSAVDHYVKDVGMSVADITKRLWDGVSGHDARRVMRKSSNNTRPSTTPLACCQYFHLGRRTAAWFCGPAS